MPLNPKNKFPGPKDAFCPPVGANYHVSQKLGAFTTRMA